MKNIIASFLSLLAFTATLPAEAGDILAPTNAMPLIHTNFVMGPSAAQLAVGTNDPVAIAAALAAAAAAAQPSPPPAKPAAQLTLQNGVAVSQNAPFSLRFASDLKNPAA